MRHTNAAATTFRLKTFKALLQQHRPAGAPLRCAVCHTFSSSFLRSGSSYGLRLTSFFASCVPLHFVSFTMPALLLTQHPGCIPSKIPTPCIPSAVSASPLFITLHYAALRHSFSSVSRRPPAAFCSDARLAAPGCVTGQCWHNTCTYKADALCHTLPLLCAPIASCGRFPGRPSQGHSQAIPSYLLHCL